MFERVRAAIDAALGVAASPADFNAAVTRMRGALVEARAAVRQLEQESGATAAGLAAERRQLEDAERRGRLAAGIGDRETVEVAQRFVSKHVEKVAVLERKLAAQQDELTLARRELAEMVEQLARVEREQQTRLGSTAAGAPGAGGRVAPDEEEELLRARMDRAAKEAQAEQQLEALKRRMGK